MRIKPARKSKVLMEIGPGEAELLSEAGAKRVRPLASGVRFKRILVPVDFSESSREALSYAVELAKEFEADVICLYVVEMGYYGAGELGYVADVEAMRQQQQEESERSLLRLIDEFEYEPMTTTVRTGVPYHEIVSVAESENVDLVVLGSHGRSGFRRFLMGSTSERVVRHAPCPVLVVRERQAQKKTARTKPAASKKPAKSVFV